MNKLKTRQLIDLVAEIEDSNLLKWKHPDPNGRIQFVRRPSEQRKLRNRQGVLQLFDFLLSQSEGPEPTKWWDQVKEKGENESDA